MLSSAFDKVGDSLIELRKMEAAEEIASHLASSRNVVYLPKDKGMLLNLPA
jgi:prohibitin 1